MVNCPVCDAELDIEEEELDEGDTLTCEECGAELRVTGTEPLELEPSEEEEEEDEDDESDVEEEDEDDRWR